MFETINNLHDQSNSLISFLLYQTALNDAKFSKRISDRQFNLIQTIMLVAGQTKKFLTQAELYRIPQIQVLYTGKTERTFYRDIARLIELNFLDDQDGLIIVGD